MNEDTTDAGRLHDNMTNVCCSDIRNSSTVASFGTICVVT